jgi:hypothetical protein
MFLGTSGCASLSAVQLHMFCSILCSKGLIQSFTDLK